MLDWCESPLTYTEADLAIGDGNAAGDAHLRGHRREAEPARREPPALWTWRVDDVTVPDILLVSGPPAEIDGTLESLFTFGSNEPGVSFECALDPLPVPEFSECASPPENLAGLRRPLPGEHTLLVRQSTRA